MKMQNTTTTTTTTTIKETQHSERAGGGVQSHSVQAVKQQVYKHGLTGGFPLSWFADPSRTMLFQCKMYVSYIKYVYIIAHFVKYPCAHAQTII